jgi:nitroreductase
MILAAQGEGLGTCCVGSFDEKEVRETVNAPNNFEVLLLLALSYTKENLDMAGKLLYLTRPRKSLSEIVSEEEFGMPLAAKQA